MLININTSYLLLLPFLVTLGWACNSTKQWRGGNPVSKINTTTRPIQYQKKGVFYLGKDTYCSNDFEGARLNGAARINDTLISVLITPENAPINESPWYAFKIWSNQTQNIWIQLTYDINHTHRYNPKVSLDGLNWESVDTSQIKTGIKVEAEYTKRPKDIRFAINASTDTLWIAAQELHTTKHLDHWIDQLDHHSFVQSFSLGQSKEGRTIQALSIGESNDEKMLILISRQHPPEVTGFLAMQSFVESLCADSELANAFRKEYNTYVIPMVNPDGVANGHWRHNSGGIDLNRDWASFNQPEIAAIRDFMQKKVNSTGGKFYCGIDFHSTWEDIYYTIDPTLNGNSPGLIPRMINDSHKLLDGIEPNIKPRPPDDAKIMSMAYFFYEYGAEALIFEIGDNTPRSVVSDKGEKSAEALMQILLNKN